MNPNLARNGRTCRAFAPDSLGDNPAVCSGCSWHALDHSDRFALGWVQGTRDHVRVIEAGIKQAVEHGHPQWSHAIAHGPCNLA